MITRRINILTILALAVACGEAGQTEETPCTLCGEMNDLTGSISSKSGNQAVMSGWVVAAIERDSGIARINEVDAAGLYTLSHVRTDRLQTMALLTPDYIFRSVLSIPSDTEQAIHQVVTFKSAYIPKLINNGPIVTFQEFRGIKIGKDLAADTDGDGIPQGVGEEGAETAALTQNQEAGMFLTEDTDTIDTDLDGTRNELDPDIDGDGVINILDPDDNGNKVLDIFDGDANGDYQPDTDPNAQDTDGWFLEGVEYITAQFEMRPTDSDNYETSLQFSCKVRGDVTPLAVQIRGAPTLLGSATYTGYDTDGNPVSGQTWNGLLFDDGRSEDANPDDRLFGQKILLSGGKAPRASETIFFELAFGDEADPWYMDFPFVFPPVKPSKISASFEPTSKQVILINKPFGDQIDDYVWTIQVFKPDDEKAYWTSEAISGTTKKFKVEDNIIEDGVAYEYSVVAQTLDKIGGIPAYSIYSQRMPME